MNTGQNAANATRPAVISVPSPATRIAIGIRASDGSGRIMRTRMSVAASAHADSPTSTPRSAPAAEAIARPRKRLSSVVPRLVSSGCQEAPSARPTSSMAGRSSPPARPDSLTAAQTPKATRTPMAPRTRRTRAGRRRRAAAGGPQAPGADGAFDAPVPERAVPGAAVPERAAPVRAVPASAVPGRSMPDCPSAFAGRGLAFATALSRPPRRGKGRRPSSVCR